jgi:hypothetical protein
MRDIDQVLQPYLVQHAASGGRDADEFVGDLWRPAWQRLLLLLACRLFEAHVPVRADI